MDSPRGNKNHVKKTTMFSWKSIINLKSKRMETIKRECEIGSDLDNTFVKYDVDKKDYRPFKLHQYFRKAIPNDQLKDIPVDVFITGRKYCYRKTTINSLLRLGVYPRYIVFFPVGFKKTNESLCRYKEEAINLLQLETYYEDDKNIQNYLRHHCPNTNIIKVGGPPIQTLR